MNMPPLVCALTGTRGTGKDTLCTRLIELDPRFRRFAFADALKRDLAPFIAEHFDIDVFTATGADKELIRPLLISYGMARRERDPLVWCRRTTDDGILAQYRQLDLNAPLLIPLITDVRFVNEVTHLRETFGAALVLVNVVRHGSPPPTDEELKHYDKVEALADFFLDWGGDTLEAQRAMADDLRQWMLRRVGL